MLSSGSAAMLRRALVAAAVFSRLAATAGGRRVALGAISALFLGAGSCLSRRQLKGSGNVFSTAETCSPGADACLSLFFYRRHAADL